MSNLLQDLNELTALAEKAKKRDDLTFPLNDLCRHAEEAIFQLNSMAKRMQSRIFSYKELEEIYTIWSDASRYVVIKQLRLDICGQGYDMYGGVTFKNPEELKRFIGNLHKDNLMKRIFKTDRHTLFIEVNQ
jgi:hypothetical protein